jgi:hypothetical protein
MDFLRAIKILSTTSFGWEVKPEVPCRKILPHVKDPLTYQRYWIRTFLTVFVHSSSLPQMSLLVGLPAISGRRVSRYPQPASWSPRLSTHIHPEDENAFAVSHTRGFFNAVGPFFLFISTGPGCVSELRPQTCFLLIPQVIYEWWNDIDGKNRRTQKNLFYCHLFYQKSTWTDPDANPGLRATNTISHGASLNKTPWMGNQPITKASIPPQDRKNSEIWGETSIT